MQEKMEKILTSSHSVRLIILLQWSLSIADTLGTAENVLISEDSGVLISGIILYTILSRWDPIWCPD